MPGGRNAHWPSHVAPHSVGNTVVQFQALIIVVLRLYSFGQMEPNLRGQF